MKKTILGLLLLSSTSIFAANNVVCELYTGNSNFRPVESVSLELDSEDRVATRTTEAGSNGITSVSVAKIEETVKVRIGQSYENGKVEEAISSISLDMIKNASEGSSFEVSLNKSNGYIARIVRCFVK